MQIGICVPARDQVHTNFAIALANLTTKLTRDNIDYQLHVVCGSVIAESRTRLANEALNYGATHLLWLDSDIHFPSTIVNKFLHHNRDIVAANYSTRYAPYRSVAFVDPEDTEQRLEKKFGLHKIWAVGMGCMMIKRQVFEQLPKPWFNHAYDKNTDTYSGEDIYFCNQAGHHGFEVWVDAEIQLAHLGTKAHLL